MDNANWVKLRGISLRQKSNNLSLQNRKAQFGNRCLQYSELRYLGNLKKHLSKKTYILLILFVLFTCKAVAQLSNIGEDQIHEIKELGIDVNIKTITKDTCNQIWVGADNGLYRFNGLEVQRYDFKYVKAVKKLRNKQIAVLTDNGLFSISTFPYRCQIDTLLLSSKTVSSQHLFYPKSLYEDKYGTLWIGEDKNIVRYKNKKVRRYHFNNINSDGFLHRSYSFAEDGFGQLWAAAYSGHLLKYDTEIEEFNVINPNLWEEASTAIGLGNNKIWVGTQNGLFEVRLTSEGQFQSTTKIADIEGISKIELIGKYAVISTWEDGLHQVDLQGSIQKISDLHNAQIFDFFIEQNEIWIANREKILCVYPSSIELIVETQNKFTPSVNLLDNNRLVINTGRNVYLTTQSYKGLSQQLVFSTKQKFWINDATLVRDTLWMSTSKGIYIFNKNTQELNQIVSGKKNDWNNKLFLDSNNTIWIGGKAATPTISVKNGKVKYWKELKGCLAITENEEGTLFAAGENSTIFRQKNEKFERLNLDFPTNRQLNINALQFQQDILYVGTSQGLWKTNISELSTKKPQLLFEGDISSLVIDQNHNLWFGCNQGLIMWQGNGRTSLQFSRTNGLPSKYIVSGGLTIDANQQIWISTSKGVAKASIETLTQTQTPKPHLTSLHVRNKKSEVSSSDLGNFNTGDHIGVNMTTLIFPADDIHYKGTLILNNEVYSSQEEETLLSFFNLKKGVYTLKVEAKRSDLQWSPPAYYSFTVTNPWYKTIWFYAFLTFLLPSLIILLSNLNNRRLRRSNERLEILIQKRTENVKQQKNSLILNQNQIIRQQKEIIQKNIDLTETQKALANTEIKYLEVKKDQIQSALSIKNKQLTTHTLLLVEKNQLLMEVGKKLESISKNKDLKTTRQNIRKLVQQIKNSIKSENHWDNFRLYFEQVHTDFYTKLKAAYPTLTTNDLKQCALVKLNLSLDDSAALLGVSSESVRISRYRIQKKMGLSSQASFYNYLMKA